MLSPGNRVLAPAVVHASPLMNNNICHGKEPMLGSRTGDEAVQ